MTIYLYKKIHNQTGLQYLGKTKQNPYKYKGSGKDWVLHIKEHGYDVTTEILKECKTNKELSHWGRYYSSLWNVARSVKWANRIPETGGGGLVGDSNPMKKSNIVAKISGKNHYTNQPGYIETRGGDKHHMKTEKHRSRMRGDGNPMRRAEIIQKHAENNKVAQNNPQTRAKKAELAKTRWSDEAFKDAVSDRIREANTVEVRAKKSLALSGKKQQLITCPHCLKQGGNNMKRYHFDNCKHF